MKGARPTNVAIIQCLVVLELLAAKDETLLIGWNAFFVLNLGFDASNGIAETDTECDSFTSECFHEDLRAA